jgi:hypothetical protein
VEVTSVLHRASFSTLLGPFSFVCTPCFASLGTALTPLPRPRIGLPSEADSAWVHVHGLGRQESMFMVR